MDWAGEKTSVRRTPARHCACSALLDFLHGLPPRTTARQKTSGFGGYMPSTIKQCKTMQNSCHAMRKIVQNEILLQAVHTCTPCSNSIFSAQNRVKSYSPRPYVQNQKKTGPVKKEWQVGQDNDSRSRRPRTAAPRLAQGRMVPSC